MQLILSQERPGLQSALAAVIRHCISAIEMRMMKGAPKRARASTDCLPIVSRDLKSWSPGPATVNTDRALRGSAQFTDVLGDGISAEARASCGFCERAEF